MDIQPQISVQNPYLIEDGTQMFLNEPTTAPEPEPAPEGYVQPEPPVLVEPTPDINPLDLVQEVAYFVDSDLDGAAKSNDLWFRTNTTLFVEISRQTGISVDDLQLTGGPVTTEAGFTWNVDSGLGWTDERAFLGVDYPSGYKGTDAVVFNYKVKSTGDTGTLEVPLLIGNDEELEVSTVASLTGNRDGEVFVPNSAAWFDQDLIIYDHQLRSMFPSLSGEATFEIQTLRTGNSFASNNVDSIKTESGDFVADASNMVYRNANGDANVVAFFRITDPTTNLDVLQKVLIDVDELPENAIAADSPTLREDLAAAGGAGYYVLQSGYLVPVDVSSITDERQLAGVYYCDPTATDVAYAQFMDPNTGDIAPTLGGNIPPREAYDGTSAIERYCVCVDELPFFVDPLIESGVEGVDFWYDGAISPNFNQDAFWYRGGAPLEEGGDSKYWFKFKNTDTTDVLTGGGEYALVATKRDALDNGASLDSLTGEYVFSKSFVSPDGIRLYAGIDEAAIQELSNGGAEDIEVYRWDVAAGQIVGTDGREILGGRLDNRFDTIGEEYAGSLSELNNNAYSDTLA